MDKLDALAVAHGSETVEAAAWQWAAMLDADTCAGVEQALAEHGIEGIGDLLAVGPALGGMSESQLDSLLAAVEASLLADVAA